ncbi:periplasmic Cu(I)/Cu(II)-binding protein CopK [Azospira restricta]|uniref:Periplasmic Cu(I)/Cu(II)-binding protein CopK n=1 Tax=Azospira restricta TaxID=404405 RepID=A0A974Y4K5_9RHOO|nr:periplasmic Cu(I)/Cu(II)-binding protein CopK [Azospira restricta]QRJ64605.1 periplasmic Cu(I)/Cu(II)-binding protein CopK [Azospira restricta]
MLTKLVTTAASILIATSAFAVDQGNVVKSYELKDGSTVYVFKDGKMAMENKVGQVVPMKEGHMMEAKDGQKIMMKGNEIWRLDSALHRDHRGN